MVSNVSSADFETICELDMMDVPEILVVSEKVEVGLLDRDTIPDAVARAVDSADIESDGEQVAEELTEALGEFDLVT